MTVTFPTDPVSNPWMDLARLREVFRVEEKSPETILVRCCSCKSSWLVQKFADGIRAGIATQLFEHNRRLHDERSPEVPS